LVGETKYNFSEDGMTEIVKMLDKEGNLKNLLVTI